jgi:hypothetical protein
MVYHSAYFTTRIDTIAKNGLLDEKSIQFYRALFEYLDAEYSRYAGLPGLPAVRGEDLPLSRHSAVILNGDMLRTLAAGTGPLAAIMAAHHPGLVLEPLTGPLAKDENALSGLVVPFLTMDHERMAALSLSHKTGLEEFVFIMTNLLRPLMALLRERSAAIIPEGGSPLLCPFCGQYPDMAVIGGGDEGKRFLHCSLCGLRWTFKRLACAVCGTEDASKLEYLSTEEDTRYRIDVCHECGGYIKTLRLDKFEEPEARDLAVENVITAGLDGAALREGYRRP